MAARDTSFPGSLEDWTMSCLEPGGDPGRIQPDPDLTSSSQIMDHRQHNESSETTNIPQMELLTGADISQGTSVQDCSLDGKPVKDYTSISQGIFQGDEMREVLLDSDPLENMSDLNETINLESVINLATSDILQSDITSEPDVIRNGTQNDIQTLETNSVVDTIVSEENIETCVIEIPSEKGRNATENGNNSEQVETITTDIQAIHENEAINETGTDSDADSEGTENYDPHSPDSISTGEPVDTEMSVEKETVSNEETSEMCDKNETEIDKEGNGSNETPETGSKETENEEESFEVYCSECNKGFQHEKLLKMHIFKHHPELRPFSCNKCPKSFATNTGTKSTEIILAAACKKS